MTDQQRQNLLAYLGYYKLTADGDWGSGSRDACRMFQRTYNDITGKNIQEDGYGGPETDKALKDAVANDLMKPDQVPEVVGSKNEITPVLSSSTHKFRLLSVQMDTGSVNCPLSFP